MKIKIDEGGIIIPDLTIIGGSSAAKCADSSRIV